MNSGCIAQILNSGIYNLKNVAQILLIFFIVSCEIKGQKKFVDLPHEDLGRIIDSLHPITMDQFIGMNAFVDDPVDKLAAVGFIREYHNWEWDEGNWNGGYRGFPFSEIKFSPSEPGWSYDSFYENLQKAGLTVAPCIQGAPGWLHGREDFPRENKPIDNPGISPADPQSYYKKSHFMYQFAARYGHSKIDPSKLTLAKNQQQLSGLGMIQYLEDWNEQDKDWEGPNANFSPEQYAAMASANYDGHCNTLTKIAGNYGIKNADSSIKFVMGGLASQNLDYIKKMKTWFENNRRDKKFVPDVINFHMYTFKEGANVKGGSGPAYSPEEGRLREKFSEIVKYRNEYLPGVEVWVSEFGWDTNPNSSLAAAQVGPFDIQETQGIWLVRGYLALAAAGVDRAQMYMSRDVDPNDATWYSSSGLMGPKGDFTPKKSWYYVYTLKNLLKDQRYFGIVPSNDKNILIYKFKNIKNDSGTYVLWAKTTSNYVATNVPVKISAKAKNVSLVNLLVGSTNGEPQNITISNNHVYLPVTEKPVFLKTDVME